jgi:hypothetical protein
MAEEAGTAVDRMKKIEQVLDQYERSVGLTQYQETAQNTEVERYLNMTREQMEKLDPESCAIAAITLSSFAFHLQRSCNREVARMNWADNVLKEMISGRETQYRGSWESQFHQAIKEDNYAASVAKIKTYAKLRIDRLNYLSNSVKHLADLFTNMQRAKAMS